MPTHQTTYNTRRSPVLSTGAMVATSQPLAAQVGLQILRQGGNAADAAVATAAVLNVVEPMSTGVGGDCFALFYEAKNGAITSLNGSGRSPAALTLEDLRAEGLRHIPGHSAHSVTVPGAVQGWADLLARHGSMTLAEVLQPAIHYAETGYPVSPLIASKWQQLKLYGALRPENPQDDYPPGGKAPATGQIVCLPALGSSLRAIAEGGSEAFYTGPIAEAIAGRVQREGGRLTVDDLKTHKSTWEEPISINYRGVQVYECPPNGQGIAALLALNILNGFTDLPYRQTQSATRLHIMIEVMRLAFDDAGRHVADPDFAPAPLKMLLSDDHALEQRGQISYDKSIQPPAFGGPSTGSDTVYLTVVDTEGNACSFINSLYENFGSGLIAGETGVILQNRGSGFSLNPEHPNRLEPGKRPYHTIIPGMATKNGKLFASFGVMGGFMQPQGHLQVISALVDADMDPQSALDRPRFRVIGRNGAKNGAVTIAIEEGYGFDVMAELANLGHQILPVGGVNDRMMFGGGQIILRDPQTDVYWGGSDPRKDGAAVAF